jgi:signal transduction histidine kinase
MTLKHLPVFLSCFSPIELTAGIAHEIQNPLNFVTNFSEVNTELLEDVNKSLDEGNTEGKNVLKDIETNMGKITFHRKRADAIVKGMLPHSRANSGQKIPTDVNALADEYLRLSYYGLRARDKRFNAQFTTYKTNNQ